MHQASPNTARVLFKILNIRGLFEEWVKLESESKNRFPSSILRFSGIDALVGIEESILTEHYPSLVLLPLPPPRTMSYQRDSIYMRRHQNWTHDAGRGKWVGFPLVDALTQMLGFICVALARVKCICVSKNFSIFYFQWIIIIQKRICVMISY